MRINAYMRENEHLYDSFFTGRRDVYDPKSGDLRDYYNGLLEIRNSSKGTEKDKATEHARTVLNLLYYDHGLKRGIHRIFAPLIKAFAMEVGVPTVPYFEIEDRATGYLKAIGMVARGDDLPPTKLSTPAFKGFNVCRGIRDLDIHAFARLIPDDELNTLELDTTFCDMQCQYSNNKRLRETYGLKYSE